MDKITPISDVVWFQEGPGVRNTQYTTEGIKLLNVANLVDGEVDLSNTNRYISEEEAYGKYKHFLVDEGDLIIASSGIKVDYFDKKMGFIKKEHLPLCMNTSTIRFKTLNADVLDIRYFMYFLKSESFKQQLAVQITGSAQLNFGPSHLKKMSVKIVPMAQQKEIVHNLSEIDRLISYRQQQLIKLDELVKSRFIEMFGDPVNNPMGWQVAEFSQYIIFLTSGSRGWAQYFSNEGEYFITIKNVKNCKITLEDVQYVIPPNNAEAKRTRVQEGDLLISITADLGRTGVVSKEIATYGGYINQHLTCIRLDQSKLRPLYAAYFLESDAGKNQFQAKNQNGVKAGLNFNAINSLKLLVPPVEVQDAFISFVEQTDKLKFEVKEALEKLEILKKSLMQQYFG